jgi:hypothetical protein
MTIKQTLSAASIGGFALLAFGLLAQSPPQTPPGDTNPAGIPAPRGVYYHAANDWVALSSTVLMPFWEGRAAALEILNVGSDHAIAELPGSHAGVQIANDVRPTLYLRDIDLTDVYLVRATAKAHHRELRMPIGRHFREWAHFRDQDVTNVDIQAVNGNVVAIKPSADLKPGEYALASGFQPEAQWIRLGFDFGIVGGRTGQ